MIELTARAFSPSRRPCIHGANCTQTCCNLAMVTYGSDTKKRQRGNSNKKSYVENQSTSSQENTSSSDDDICHQSEDVVDACLNQSSKYELGKSSSFDISPYRDKPSNSWNYSPSLSLDSFTESQKYSRSTPEVLQRTPITSSPLENQKSRKKNSYTPECTNYRINTESQGNTSGNNSYILIFLCLCVFAVLLQYQNVWYFNWNTSENKYTDQHFEQDLEGLSHKFNIQFDPMRLQSGIRATFEREDTSSVIFLYRYIDENKVKRFVREVAAKSAKFLRNDTASPIVVKNTDLDMQTSKELLEKYRKKLADEGVVIFQDLEAVPVNLAMAFHYYCDEYNPLSKKTAVFFTLNMEKCTNFIDGEAHVGSIEDVEKCLKNKWIDLGDERLPPLLSRVINIVINLKPN